MTSGHIPPVSDETLTELLKLPLPEPDRSIIRELQERRATEKKEWRCAVDFLNGPEQVGRLRDSAESIQREHRNLSQRWECRIQFRTVSPWTDADQERKKNAE